MNIKNLKIGDMLVIVASGMNLPPIEITRIEDEVLQMDGKESTHIYHFDNEGWGIPGNMLQERLDKGTMILYEPTTQE